MELTSVREGGVLTSHVTIVYSLAGVCAATSGVGEISGDLGRCGERWGEMHLGRWRAVSPVLATAPFLHDAARQRDGVGAVVRDVGLFTARGVKRRCSRPREVVRERSASITPARRKAYSRDLGR